MRGRKWEPSEAIMALQEEAVRLGRVPLADDMRDEQRVCASPQTYMRLFGSIRNALVAAGLREAA